MTKQEISEIKSCSPRKTAPSPGSADAMWMERRIKDGIKAGVSGIAGGRNVQILRDSA